MSNLAVSSQKFYIAATVLAATLSPALASAQAVTVANRNASQFEAAATPADADDAHRLRLQVGGSWIEGNSRALTGNLATRYQLRRAANELTAEALINLGFAVPAATMGMMAARDYQRNAENYLLRARYDRYFGENSLFISPLFFRDTFSGFNFRVSTQVGYMRNFFNDPGKQKFKGEFGVDATFENLAFTGAAPPRCPAGTAMGTAAMPGSCGLFAFMGRIYLGYENHMSSSFDLTAGVETLVNFLGLNVPNSAPDIRINGNLGAAFKVSDFFSVGAQWNIRVMVQPVPPAQPVDSSLLLTLNFTHSFDAPPPAPAPEPVVPTCPTCPTCPEPAPVAEPPTTPTTPASATPTVQSSSAAPSTPAAATAGATATTGVAPR
jgi:hypothetical protein